MPTKEEHNRKVFLHMLERYGKVIASRVSKVPIGHRVVELGMPEVVVVREATPEEWWTCQAAIDPEFRANALLGYIYELAGD